MADVRSVSVRLSAEVSGYIANMKRAGDATDDAMSKSEKSAHRASVGISDVEKAGAGAAVLLAGKAVMAAADFDQAMSKVEAATHGTAAEMASLEQAALDAGKATSFSATEAAAGIENLSKAGVSTSDILGGGLTGALDLAAAGELAVADAAEIAATALTQFKLKGEDIPHVADLLAAGAGKAQGEVTDLAQALNQSGLVAAQMGLSIEETTGVLSAFASAGLLGSDAGTSFKTMLLRLANPSKEAANEMERFGISAYDAQGNMVSASDLAGQLENAFKGQSQATRDAAMATIFGSDAIRGANVLYSEGADGIANWTTAVDDAGYAAETAAIKMDNLKGDVEVLMGSIETALIGSGDSSQDTLRTTTQLLTELVDVMNEVQGGESLLSEGFRGAVDQLSVVNSPVFKVGLDNLKKTKDALFGVDDAATDAAKASEEKAAADSDAAAASAQMAAKVQQSAAELEAQEKALKEARDAARDTASQFFNLGDSVNDAKVSLDDWIADMAESADALNNFTSNAEKAATKGLRQGLIDALKEAGPEGALRMKQLANATEGEIARANKAWSKGEKAIDRYVTATAGVPGDVSTTLFLDSKGAMADLAQARRELAELDGREAHALMVITTQYKTVGNATDAFPDRNRRREATGGFIAGPGTATSDSIPALLSNGEYVIRAAAVDHYGMGFFDRANAIRLAGGGSADGKKKKRNVEHDDETTDAAAQAAAEAKARREEERDRIAEHRADAAEQDRQRLVAMEEDRIAAAEKAAEEAAQRQREVDDAILDGQHRAWDIATDAVKAQVDAAQQMVDTVKANMDRLGDAATSAFKGNIFEASSQQHGLWTGANTTAAGGWRGNLTGDIAGLEERSGLIRQLSDPSLGLSASALEALLGQSDNAGIAAMLAAGEVDDYAALFAQREKLLGEVSTQAGMAGYGQEYASASAELVLTNQKLDLLNALIAQARPITVTETISAAALAAEVARLQAATGGF